jgi:N-acetylglucosaminyldiphosphoundecaprenol N-acetyl-beta-D-mannosaminyltransferase
VTPGSRSVLRIADLQVSPLRMEEVMGRVDEAIASRRRLRIGVVNAAKIVEMTRDPLLRQDVLSSDLVLADGASVVWAERLLGRPLPERLAGIDLMLRILKQGHERGYSIFCLGATDDVLRKAVSRISADYSGGRIAGAWHGYFTDREETALAAEIDAASPDVLFVAMSSPRKERFMARWGDRLDVRVWHGVGGAFDVLAGKVRRAPLAWQRLGLEWLYRVLQEPGRLWKRYLVTNTVFCVMLLRELVYPRRRASRS